MGNELPPLGFLGMPKMDRHLFGTDFDFPRNSRNGDKHDVISVRSSPECNVPTVFGVQINTIIAASTAFGIGSIPGLRAELIWGVDGGNFTATVDAMEGVSLNVVAQTLRVTLFDESAYAGGGTSSLASPFRGTGSCVFGGLPKTQPAIRTIRPTAVGDTITIPKFARRVTVARFDSTLATSGYDLAFQNALGNTISNVTIPNGAELQGMIIPSDAVFIAPTLGVGVTIIRYIFSLDL